MDKKVIFLFLLVIFSLKCFDASFARTDILKNITYGYMLIAILISLPFFFKKSGGFILPIQLICISIVISVFMAKFTWGQGFQYFPTTIPFLIWFVFFYLVNSDISINTIEKIVLIYGMIYIILFLFQFTHTGVVYFGTHDEFLEDRGVIRVNFPGGGVFFLSCFIAVSKVTNKVKYRYLWLLYSIIGIVIIVLQVTRQEIVVLLIIYLFHFLQNVKLIYKVTTIALFALAGYVFINSDNTISKGLIEQQKKDASEGSDYIRILEAEYYLTQFTPNTASKILGNGVANDTSNYGKYMISLDDNYGYYLSDIGLIETYIIFGFLAIAGYVLIFIKSITIPLPEQYAYLKYYLWMIGLTALTSDFLISFNFLITTVFVLSCYQRLYEQNNLGELVISDLY
jgi:hypothetical protein